MSGETTGTSQPSPLVAEVEKVAAQLKADVVAFIEKEAESFLGQYKGEILAIAEKAVEQYALGALGKFIPGL